MNSLHTPKMREIQERVVLSGIHSSREVPMGEDIFTPAQRALLKKAAAESDAERRRQLDEEFNTALTPEQRARLDASVADGETEVLRQMRRTNVELSLDDPDLVAESDEPVQVAENVVVVNTYTDLSAIRDTLAELADGAGTDAFRAAYNGKRAREAALKRHAQRLELDTHLAWKQLLAVHPLLKDGPENAVMAAFLSTMEGLPDGAGTAAFVAAHHARLSSDSRV
ncbi:MAG: hypothetical protein ACREN6_05720 [Gemmatimonadaceae bacterium]